MVQIRDATDDDIDALSVVQTRSWQVGYRGQLPARLLDGLDSERRAASWRELRESNPDLSLLVSVRDGHDEGDGVGDADGEVTGFICIEASRDDDATDEIGEVYAIYVDPDHWGRGTGAALLAAGLERLASRGYRSATLWVLSSNARSRRFYEHHGWQPDGTEKTETAAAEPVTFHEVRYVRAL